MEKLTKLGVIGVFLMALFFGILFSTSSASANFTFSPTTYFLNSGEPINFGCDDENDKYFGYYDGFDDFPYFGTSDPCDNALNRLSVLKKE